MSDLNQLLTEYCGIVRQLQDLEDKKNELRQEIRELVHQQGNPVSLLVGNTRVNARVVTTVKIDYDEAGLSERLGARYRSILVPDVKKVRHHLAELRPVLEPYLETIGSVSPERVAEQIESGVMAKEEFTGLFTKEHKSTLYVQVNAAESQLPPSNPER